MPPTIIVTVGRLALAPAEAELPPPAVAELPPAVPPAGAEPLPDEQAATVSVVAHAAARAASKPLLRLILRMVLLLCCDFREKKSELDGRRAGPGNERA